MDESDVIVNRREDSSHLIAQDDTAAPQQLHTPTHLEKASFSAAFTSFEKICHLQLHLYYRAFHHDNVPRS